MSAISSSLSTNPALTSQAQSKTADSFSTLGTNQFLKIIFAELNQQDPLKPNDTSKLIEQLSSLRSIQADSDLQAKLSTLVNQNQFASAAGLLGRTISGLDELNTRVLDQVVTVTKNDSGPVLVTKQGFRVPFSQVDQLAESAPTAPTEPQP